MYHKKRRSRPARRKTSRRRGRVSGIKDVDFTSIGLVVAGAVAGRILYNKLSTSTNATMVKLAPYAGLLAGIVLPMVTKEAMMKALSMGLVASGGVNMLVGLKVITGIENTVGNHMMHRVGYPYNVVPYQRRVAGIVNQQNQFVNKANFSGSGKSQMNVIGGVPGTMAGSGFSTGGGDGSLY